MSRISRFLDQARTWTLGVIILGGPAAIAFLAPEPWLNPIGFGGLVIGVLGVLAIRRYMTRLMRFEKQLALPENEHRPELLVGPMSMPERALLGVLDVPDANAALHALRASRALLVSAGMIFGVAALVSFILLMFMYAD